MRDATAFQLYLKFPIYLRWRSHALRRQPRFVCHTDGVGETARFLDG